MFSNRVFQVALIISAIVHGVILYQNHDFLVFQKKTEEKSLETRYIKMPEKENQELKISLRKLEPPIKLPSKITLDKTTPPPFQDKEEFFRKNQAVGQRGLSLDKPKFASPDVIAIKKRITLPSVDLDKIDNPSYISYYQTVREKIKRAAYQNYTSNEVGEVYMSFIISSDGNLNDVRVVEEKSSSNSSLKDIALASIKAAAPFPNFPKELDYPSLSFNVVISFEID